MQTIHIYAVTARFATLPQKLANPKMRMEREGVQIPILVQMVTFAKAEVVYQIQTVISRAAHPSRARSHVILQMSYVSLQIEKNAKPPALMELSGVTWVLALMVGEVVVEEARLRNVPQLRHMPQTTLF